jgi:hypothetical protein
LRAEWTSNGSWFDERVVAPDQIQLVAAEHSTRRPEEGCEELELRPGEIHAVPVHRDFAAVAVQLERPFLR